MPRARLMQFSYLLVVETQICSSRNSDLITVANLIVIVAGCHRRTKESAAHFSLSFYSPTEEVLHNTFLFSIFFTFLSFIIFIFLFYLLSSVFIFL